MVDDDDTLPPAPGTEPDARAFDHARRQDVVRVALRELGQGDPLKYWRVVLPKTWNEFQVKQFAASQDWCGGFALWCLREAGLAQDIDWKMGAGFCFRLPTTKAPQPGDIAYFEFNAAGKRVDHHAIVARVDDAAKSVFVVNGNGSGGVVTTSTHHIRQATAYFSIQPLIDREHAT